MKKYSVWAKIRKGFTTVNLIEWYVLFSLYVISAAFIFSPDTQYLSILGIESIDFAITVAFIYLLYVWGGDALEKERSKLKNQDKFTT